MKELIKQEWYELLVDDCRAIIIEKEFIARWSLVECYHELGKRILEENDNFNRADIYGKEIVKRVSISLNKGERTIRKAIQFATKYPILQEAPFGKNVTIRYIFNELLPESLMDNKPTLNGKFDIIYADPPWKYNFSETEKREIERQYPTMEIAEIKNLQIPTFDNAVLFLWATAPKLKEAIEVIECWGFEYKTCSVWDKEIIGMGYWFRGQHELLLVGTKGEYSLPEEGIRISSVYKERRTKHSKKPDYYYEVIEKYFPNGRYLELFARQQYNNKWTVWGNEV